MNLFDMKSNKIIKLGNFDGFTKNTNKIYFLKINKNTLIKTWFILLNNLNI